MKKILLVEDDRILSLLLEKQIKKMGYELVAKVDTGEKAISTARSLNPDLILMDIKLNGEIDGIDAISKIQSFSEVPFIYLTGNSDPKTRVRAKTTNPNAYLLKPITYEMLQTTLTSIFR